MNSNKGQVWVETVIYTLIGLTIIGVLLTLVTPKINETRDKIVIEQSVEALNFLDGKISEARFVAGNTRQFSLTIKKGEMIFDGENDTVEFFIRGSKFVYSEPGVEITEGRVKVLTSEVVGRYDVSLKIDYSGSLNITYQGEDVVKTLQQASVPYDLSLTNEGVANNRTEISFSI
ncbi:MAG: hypothetical protein ABIE22_05175 [archaeon]